MGEPVLTVLVQPAAEGRLEVRAPAVGHWEAPPREGVPVGPGSPIGTLRRAHRRFVLALPETTAGIVEAVPHERSVAVQYGERLFRLAPLHGTAGHHASTPAATDVRTDLPAGTRAVRAPTDGVVYRGPAPGEPAFVEAGSAIRPGQPLGLIEVMKTFNPIVYGGPGWPEEAQVVEVRCDDAAEVRAGQILFVVR
jgi:acetyl-CoA carboxylase biotin carboxyl carrier protein